MINDSQNRVEYKHKERVGEVVANWNFSQFEESLGSQKTKLAG